jgi:hypothetical protein
MIEESTIDYKLEQHLRELGILPANTFDELSELVEDYREKYLAKGYFNDPRDPVTGEVPF